MEDLFFINSINDIIVNLYKLFLACQTYSMKLLSPVQAQTIDEIASPTIPFNPPGVVTGTPVATQVVSGPSISISIAQNEIAIGENATVQVIINTQATEVSQYSFQITYDPTVLQVIDADTTLSNVQIDFQDTFFLATQNQVNSSAGVISLTAASDQGTTTITNRIVAEFDVKGLKDALTDIEVIKANSFLLNASATDILQTTNSLVLSVTGEVNPSISTLPSSTPVASNVTPLPTITPDTALEDIGGLGTLIIGAVLIILGFYITKYKKHERIRR